MRFGEQVARNNTVILNVDCVQISAFNCLTQTNNNRYDLHVFSIGKYCYSMRFVPRTNLCIDKEVGKGQSSSAGLGVKNTCRATSGQETKMSHSVLRKSFKDHGSI